MKNSWKKRFCCLALAAILLTGQCMPAFAEAALGTEPSPGQSNATDQTLGGEEQNAANLEGSTEMEETDPLPPAQEPLETQDEVLAQENILQAEQSFQTTQQPAPMLAALAADAVWSDSFETAVTATGNSATYWKNALVPTGWNNIWVAVAPAAGSMYFELTDTDKTHGGQSVHIYSTSATGRLDVFKTESGLDYSKDYVLRAQIKTKDVTGTGFYLRAQVGEKGNKALPVTKITGTQDWTLFELELTGLAELAGDDSGVFKLELFADQMTGEVWIDNLQISPKQDPAQSPDQVLWATSFDDAVAATGNAAKYFVDGTGPKDFMSAWVPNAPATDKFQLKLDDTTKVSGAYSLYAKSTYQDKTSSGVVSNQRLKLAAASFPQNLDYTKDYILRAMVKITNAGHSNWGGAALRVDLQRATTADTGSITGTRLLGTKDWYLVELSLTDLDEKTGLTSGSIEPSIMYEYFTGEIWVDDMELILVGDTLAIEQETLALMIGETGTLTTNASATDTVVWASSNESVATVDATGLVTGIKGGIAVITAAVGDQVSAGCTVTVTDPKAEKSFAAMRQKWTDRLTGNPYWQAENTDASYLEILNGYDQAAKTAWDSMVKNSATQLFGDLDLDISKKFASSPNSTNSNDSVDFSTAISRMQDMARAWAAEGSAYYHNEALKTDILYAMQWAYDHFYNEKLNNQAMFGNWYHWWTSMPQNLAGTVILMHDVLDADLLQAEAATLARFCEDPAYVYKVKGAAGVLMYDEMTQPARNDLYNKILLLVPAADTCWMRSAKGSGTLYTATAANKAELAMITALNGLLGNDPACLYKASDTLASTLKYVTSGEGFYLDGSYKQHGNFAYTGTYGVEMLRGVTQIAALTNNTTWACTDADTDIIYEWILNAFRPLYADGGILDMVQGRSVSRFNRSTISTGRYAMDAILSLLANAPEQYREQLLSFAKTQVQLGTQYDPDSYYGKLRFSSLIMAKNLLADDSILPDTELYTKIYGSMDKAVVHGEHFTLGISMFSARNAATECGNNENLKGWYTADGALTLQNDDQAQYDKGYWATVDPLRLSGITTNHVTQPLANFSLKTNNRDWVGGSTIDGTVFASIGQDFKSNYSDLQAQKSWFALGDQIVALGAGIATTQGDETETIVENRRLDNNNQLVVNGKPANTDGSGSTAADWAWLSANQSGGAIGYYFPQQTQLNVLRETRTGKWSDINSANYPADQTNTVTNAFASLAISHGQTPSDASYGYVLLPGKTQAETERYAAQNTIAVLANTTAVQAAMDTKLGVSGFNFWQAVWTFLKATP